MPSSSEWIQELKSLHANEIVLILSDSTHYMENNLSVMKELLKAHELCIYVTINKPAESLMALFKENGLDPQRFYFVDCVSELVGSRKKSPNVISVSPQNLTGLSIAINEMISGLKGKKFVFLDSLSTLAVFHSTGNVQKFYHFLTNKIRVSQLKGIFLSVEKDLSLEVLSLLEKVVDKIIKI